MAIKERPILFSGQMVKAILAGKTQTRRNVKWKMRPGEEGLNLGFSGLSLGHYCTGVPTSGWVLQSRGAGGCWNDRTYPLHCPYGEVGDRLWVRESFIDGWDVVDGDLDCYDEDGNERPKKVWYRADGTLDDWQWIIAGAPVDKIPWKSSIHMPRWASRLTLQLTSTRMEKLHDITEEDAIAEGVGPGFVPSPHSRFPDIQTSRCVGYRPMFQRIWCEINGKESWDANPFVWVIGFERVATPTAAQQQVAEGSEIVCA